MENNKKVSLLEKISYGSGNMGICLATTIISTFIMYFYTDVIKLGLIQVGTIMMMGGIADAVSDMLMGIIVDHTKSRFGKCRPYIMAFAVPLAVVCFFMFHIPTADEGTKYVYALVTYILYTLAYTAVLIPQNVLLTAITDNDKDRLGINMFGSLGTNFGQLAVAAFALTLVKVLGKGNEYAGYGAVATIFGIIGAILIFIDGFNTRERMNLASAKKISLMDSIKAMNNGPWIICTLTSLFTIAVVVIKAQTTVYFAGNVLNNEGIATTLLSISNVIGIPITFCIPFLASKLGKRNLVWAGTVFSIVGSIGTLVGKEAVGLVILFSVISSVGLAFINGIIYVMCAESIDYGEWKNGVRVQGFLMAFIGFAIKIANSLVSMLITVVLNMGGYVGGAAVQTASAIRAIEFCYIGLPVILMAGVLIINIFYHLDQQYADIRKELEDRRAAYTAA
ncbi:glycoside/pentoside/hexuronide:cation symporter, GPH family [Lachnospiraceae bacterium]|nr:glycoside/pentoside/hexuronide:cation symporter, GPH family [Lachnospiraceae bacterium]